MDTLKLRLASNRWLLLAARSASISIAASAPTITELWQTRGMSKGDFYLLEIVFAIMLMVLEVITGRFADRYGKVRTLALGFGAQAIGSLVYVFATCFSEFLVGEAIFALGMALVSGTDEAFLFQTNKCLGRSASHQRWWTITVGVGFLTMAVCSVIGASLAAVDLTFPFLFSSVFGLIAMLLCFLMVEPSVQQADDSNPCFGTLKEAAHAVLFSSSALRWMILAPGFIVCVNQTFLWMYPEYLRDCNIDLSQRGYVFAVFNLVAGASSLWLRSVDDDKVAVRLVFVMLLALAASTCGLLTLVGGLAWLLILPQQMVRSVSGVLFSRTINEAIPDSVRVTALSIRNAVRVVQYVAVLTPWWLGVDSLGRNGMFQVNLLMIASAGLLFWVRHPHRKPA